MSLTVLNECNWWNSALTVCSLPSEGVWRAPVGWRLGSECWKLAVAFSKYFLSPVLQGLLPCRIWQEDGQKWRLHQVRSQSDWSQVFRNYVFMNWKKKIPLLYFWRKYLPLLKKFPAQYIYEPWKAPRSVQQAAGCIVGKDYPHPIVQHEVISKKNIQRMKLAYAKRSADPAESPSKKQSNAWNLYFYERSFPFNVSHVSRKSCLYSISPYFFLLGEKRKAPSVVDMLKKKERKT